MLSADFFSTVRQNKKWLFYYSSKKTRRDERVGYIRASTSVPVRTTACASSYHGTTATRNNVTLRHLQNALRDLDRVVIRFGLELGLGFGLGSTVEVRFWVTVWVTVRFIGQKFCKLRMRDFKIVLAQRKLTECAD